MAIRGEIAATEVVVDNRTYFFNIKENHSGDIFLQIVESKGVEGSRRDVVIFASELQKFCVGFNKALSLVEKAQKDKSKRDSEKKKALSQEKKSIGDKKPRANRTRKPSDDGIKRTGKVHVVSKRTNKE